MSHLSRDERLLALDGALDATRQVTPDGLSGVRTDVETLGRVLARVGRSRPGAVAVVLGSSGGASATIARAGAACSRAAGGRRAHVGPAAAVVIAAAGAGYLPRGRSGSRLRWLRTAHGLSERDPGDHAPSANVPRRLGPSPTTAGADRRSPTGRERRPSRRRSDRQAVDLGADPTSAGALASWPPNWRPAGSGKDDPIMWGRTFRRAAARSWPRCSSPSAGTDLAGAQPRRLRLAAAARRPGTGPQDRARTRPSIRPSSDGCSTPTR